MQRIDLFEYFTLGNLLDHLRPIRAPTGFGGKMPTWSDAGWALIAAQGVLEPFLANNTTGLEASIDAGKSLLAVVMDGKQKAEAAAYGATTDITYLATLQGSLNSFTQVLRHELPRRPTYIVGKKGGLRVDSLIDSGEEFFPADLATKVPDAISDFRQGTRCLAFDLWTAAGYHFHRANEVVLRSYWDVATSGRTRPTRATMGWLVTEMTKIGVGDPKVLAALRDIINLHRNPLAHPEQSLTDVNEAIGLMNGIHSAVVHMLRSIP